MKPDIDLDDPNVKMGISIHSTQMEKALEVSQRVESAVFPIYHLIRGKKKVEQIGSGVAVQIKDQFFIFSASHIFDDIKTYQLLISTGVGKILSSFAGDRFSSAKGPSGTHADDPIDASVFHIQSNVPSEIKKAALSMDDFDFSQPDTTKSVHMAAGFRVKKSKTFGNKATAKRECFPSAEYGETEYSELNIDKNTHLALAYEDQVLVNGRWQTSPQPRGISGGAMIKVSGITLAPPFLCSPEAKQLLSAITIEQRREKSGKPGVLVGTRIGVHLGLICEYLPDL